MSQVVNEAILCVLKVVIDPTLEIPPAGDVVISCPNNPDCSTTLPGTELFDQDSSQELTYSVVQLGSIDGNGWAVLRPDVPLVLGQHFVARRSERLEQDAWIDQFRVVDPEALPPDEFDYYAALYAAITPSTETVCCGPVGGCGSPLIDEVCTSERQQVLAKLSVGLNLPTAASSQWLYQATFQAGNDSFESELFPWNARAQHVFDVDLESYCYTLTAQSIADGTRVMVEQKCVGNSLELGEQATDLDEFNSTLRLCAEPPPGWQAEWCDAWLACKTSPQPECQWPREVCGWATTDAGVDADDGGSDHPNPSSGLPERAPGDGSLCSLDPGATGSRPVAWAWLSLLLAGLLRRFFARAPEGALRPGRRRSV